MVSPLLRILSNIKTFEKMGWSDAYRKRAKGRDFYDVIFLLQKTKPNYDYLFQKTGINNSKLLKEKILDHVKDLNLKELAKDVEPFLFKPSDSKKIIRFHEYIKQINI